MSAYLHIAEKAAVAAGRIITQHYNRLERVTIRHKALNNPVSNVDLECEQEIKTIIHRAYPHHTIVAEESATENTTDEWQWFVDPLDGTANFIYGLPHCAVSIALIHKKTIVLGVVYDPFKNELFTAEKGQGATLNQRKIRVSEHAHLQGAMLGTGLPFRLDQDINACMNVLQQILQERVHVRRAGAAALDLAYVACARFDGFWEFGLQPWDIAAGIILVKEAGGMVGTPSGTTEVLESGDILAANTKIFKPLLSKITSV